MPDDVNCEQPSRDPNSDTLAPIPKISTVPLLLERPTANNGKDDTEKSAFALPKKPHWLKRAYYFSQILLAGIGIGALCIYHGQQVVMQHQLDQMTKQLPLLQESADAAKLSADLTKAQLESTQSAVIETYITRDLQMDGSTLFSIELINEGKATAKDINGDFTIARKGASKSLSRSVHLQKGELSGSGANLGSQFPNGVDLGEFSKGSIEQGLEIVQVSGDVRYDNGFGTVVHDAPCQVFMRVAMINVGTSGNNYWGVQSVPCGKVDETNARNRYYSQNDLKGK